jgi:hypothetical protein
MNAFQQSVQLPEAAGQGFCQLVDLGVKFGVGRGTDRQRPQ